MRKHKRYNFIQFEENRQGNNNNRMKTIKWRQSN